MTSFSLTQDSKIEKRVLVFGIKRKVLLERTKGRIASQLFT